MAYKNKADQLAAQRIHYVRNKEQRIALSAQRHEEIKQYIRRAKDVPCADCSIKYPYYVMDFDHVRGEKITDLAKVARLGWGKQKIDDEIDKCDVVCANCHRERTHRP